MKYVLLGIAMTGVMLAGPKAPAADTAAQNQSVVYKRQLVGCMTKRMLSSRTVSYNDARKVCTAELKPQSDSLPHPLTAAR